MDTPAHTDPIDLDGYFPIDLADAADAARGLDVYLKHPSTDQPTLYCAAGAPLSDADRDRLLRQGVRRIFAPLDQHHRFACALLANLARARGAGRLTPGALLRAIATLVSEPLRSGAPESVRGVAEAADTLADWLAADPDGALPLLDIAGHDYDAASHMVHVGVGAGLLAMRMAPGDRELLRDAILGGLLHDIGKRGVEDRILKKQGPLAPDEWRMVRRHPEVGAATVEACPDARPGAVAVVRDHHERLDGQGYPRGVDGSAIARATRLCTIVDAFDAVTASRPYRRAIHPLDALEIMREGVGAHFDPEAFEAWASIVHEGAALEAERLAGLRRADSAGAPSVSSIPIEKILQSPPEGMAPYLPAGGVSMNQYWNSERRGADRKPVRLRITARLLRTGKAAPAAPGEDIELLTVDLSVGGAQVITPWAFSQGDVLLLTIPGPEGKKIVRHARVVRVRERSDGAWSAGLEFVQRLGASEDVAEKPAA